MIDRSRRPPQYPLVRGHVFGAFGESVAHRLSAPELRRCVHAACFASSRDRHGRGGEGVAQVWGLFT